MPIGDGIRRTAWISTCARMQHHLPGMGPRPLQLYELVRLVCRDSLLLVPQHVGIPQPIEQEREVEMHHLDRGDHLV